MACAGSTEPAEAGAVPPGFDAARPYELHPDVALRPEPFGALAYHYGNRRLNFLRSPQLVELVRQLGEHGSATTAMDATGIEPGRRRSFERALTSLLSSEVIRAR